MIRAVKYLMACLLIVGALSIVLVPTSVSAQEGSDQAASTSCGSASFLGFPAWYNGLAEADAEGDCAIVSPNKVGGMEKFVWIIVLNVVEMLLRAAGYAAVAFIIYGGYKYMISAGSSDGMVAARKTIMNACIGLVISIAAVAIVNTISGGMKL